MDWAGWVQKVFGGAAVFVAGVAASITWTIIKVHSMTSRIDEVGKYLNDRIDNIENKYREEKVCIAIHEALNGRLDRFRDDALSNHKLIIDQLNKQDDMLKQILLNGKGGINHD